MSATNTVNKILASPCPNWDAVSLRDVRYCVESKIQRFKELRGSRNQIEGQLETQAIANDLKRLFSVVAKKRGQRGINDLKAAIEELEGRDLEHANSFDVAQLEALRAELARLTR